MECQKVTDFLERKILFYFSSQFTWHTVHTFISLIVKYAS